MTVMTVIMLIVFLYNNYYRNKIAGEVKEEKINLNCKKLSKGMADFEQRNLSKWRLCFNDFT